MRDSAFEDVRVVLTLSGDLLEIREELVVETQDVSLDVRATLLRGIR